MSRENIDIIKGTYESFAEGDIEAVLASFAPSITWVEADGGPYGGTYKGSEEIAANVFAPLGGPCLIKREPADQPVPGGTSNGADRSRREPTQARPPAARSEAQPASGRGRPEMPSSPPKCATPS